MFTKLGEQKEKTARQFMLMSVIAPLMATPRMQRILALPYRLHTDTFHTHKTSLKVYVYTCMQYIACPRHTRQHTHRYII